MELTPEQERKLNRKIHIAGAIAVGVIALTLAQESSPPAPPKIEVRQPQKNEFPDLIYQGRTDYIDSGVSRGIDCQKSYNHETTLSKYFEKYNYAKMPNLGEGLYKRYYLVGEETRESYDGYYNLDHGWAIQYNKHPQTYTLYQFDSELEEVPRWDDFPPDHMPHMTSSEKVPYIDSQLDSYIPADEFHKNEYFTLENDQMIFNIARNKRGHLKLTIECRPDQQAPEFVTNPERQL